MNNENINDFTNEDTQKEFDERFCSSYDLIEIREELNISNIDNTKIPILTFDKFGFKQVIKYIDSSDFDTY